MPIEKRSTPASDPILRAHNKKVVSQEHADEICAELLSETERGSALRRRAMLLLSRLHGYNWCGVYRLKGETLELDEFVGTETEHTHIPVGTGVCGTAVAENKNQVIRDVRKLTNYLACSAVTRSEIVVLIRKDEHILGQIDVDGHEVGAFDASDEALLGRVAELLADRW